MDPKDIEGMKNIKIKKIGSFSLILFLFQKKKKNLILIILAFKEAFFMLDRGILIHIQR